MKKLLFSLCLLALVVSTRAAVIPFDLLGKAGSGLLPGNENGTILGTPGSGGELGAGFLFNDVTLILSINVGWGSANGFINLSGNTTGGHIHGPTPNGGVLSFTQNAGVRYALDGLPTWNPSASSGGFIGDVAIIPGDVAALLDGRFYFNVHTAVNGGGEIRGNLVAVPEPSTYALGLLGTGAFLLRRFIRRTR